MEAKNKQKKPKDILLEGSRKAAQTTVPKKTSSISSAEPASAVEKEAQAEQKQKEHTKDKQENSAQKPAAPILDDATIQQILVSKNYASKEEAQKAADQAKARRTGLVEQLISLGVVTKDLLGQALAEHFGVVYADLNTHVPTKEEVQKIPEQTAKKFRVVWFSEEEGKVAIATDNPKQIGIAKELASVFSGKQVMVAYSLPEDIDSALMHYRKSLETRFESIIRAQKRVAPEIVEEILADATSYRASDIHFEPQKQEVVIRFRIDGVLREAGRLQKQYYENMLNRIKVQAKLRIDEHESTQDGAIRVEQGPVVYDVRVSIAPTTEGEKVVMRLLSQYVRSFSLSDLGLSDINQEQLTRASKKPFGMILVTGPTGSGKSTTLYAALKSLNRPEVNVTTIEDPVEYRISGITQIQVNEGKKITFAKGLRSIVRQDPDIILVGEIRDQETAEIAVNAALTGHLLLSTFHANDAATTIPRLLDMGVEPFLMASTLELIIAQRLVRTLCEHCRYSVTVPLAEITKLNKDAAAFFGEQNRLYKGKGCSSCGDSGFSGRKAIFEFIEMTTQMKDLVLKHPSAREIWQLARTQGAKTLFEDGVQKVMAGVTTVEELLRVASPPEQHEQTKPEPPAQKQA